MDDMWSTKVWDDVKMMFPDDENGSQIILTTRLLDVASYANSSSPPHVMPFMDDEQSWNLLKHKVFAHQNCPPKLEYFGRKIAKNCRGLPLAIVVAAGLLSVGTKTIASWKKIADDLNSAVSAKDGQIERILSLSYINLPQHLRQCFLHIGSFPEDYEIRVSKLVKLWVAEGFFRPNGSKSFEEQAQEYLAELVGRSLVLIKRRKSNGEIRSCMIHDLVRDMSISKAVEEKLQRRVSIVEYDLNYLAKAYISTTHTIICFKRCKVSQGSLVKFRLLRVLDVVDAELDSLPAQIFELFHLRYLAFDYPTAIPSAISNLQNLQTLIIHPRRKMRSYYPPCVVCLPPEIWRLPQLRHLVSFFFGFLPHPEESRFPLENLRTLSIVTNLVCNERILKMIPNLKKIGISYYGDDYDQDFHLENLAHLHQLEKLKLRIYAGFAFRQKLNPAFPRTLKKLTLSNWQLPWKDMTIVGSLPNLEVLKLKDYACEGGVWETTEGEFLELKFLLISESDLQHWITESSHFPRLKCLTLYRCEYLEIPDGIGEIPTLELIEVDHHNASLVSSSKRIQEEQESWGNDAFQVRYARNY